MATIGEARRRSPSEPRNGAEPKAKTPPSSATSQYPPPLGTAAMPTTGWAGFLSAREPKKGALPKLCTPPSSEASQ
jgi:hypothetical protein